MKKALKITGIVILVLVIILISAPFLFKGTIEKQVKKAINKNVNAQVEWSDLSLSLFSSFPDARLKLKDVSVVNKAPFKGDTLVYAKSIFLDMGIPQLFKGDDEPLEINSLGLDKALVNVIVNKDGVANYDIAKASEENDDEKSEEDSGISLGVKHYEINDTRLNYLDESSKMYLRIKALNHEGNGDFSAETSTLHTKTSAFVSYAMDSVAYLNNNSIKLDADIIMDLKNMKFTFDKNELLINKLPLKFDGYVKVNDDNQELDVSFSTPTSDFKNFLGLIPEAYSKNLDGVETSGEFGVKGKLYGVIDDNHIPKMDIAMTAKNASFKYPDLPKAVSSINIDAVLKNETGLMKDLNLDLNRLNFKIDQDAFAAHGKLKNIADNMLVDLTAKGTLNLANLDKAYPIDAKMDLNGILNADLTTAFAMSDIDNKRYERVKSKGSAGISNFSYNSDELANPMKISKASINFDPGNVVLNQLDMTTGSSDIHLNGRLENLMGFLFKSQPIKGTFNLKSNKFDVGDFMVADAGGSDQKEDKKPKDNKAPSTDEAIKIPSFLDMVLNFTADKVIYDNLTLTNAKGALVIKDETATLKSISADIFGGNIGLDGSVSTKNNPPKFNVDLSLNRINIVKSFEQMEMFQKMAPVAKALVGDLTTKVELNGDMTQDLTPVYASLAGQGMAQLLNAKVQEDKLPLVSELDGKLDFLNLKDLNLKNLTTHFHFKDGGIDIDPYDFKINKDIDTKISGRHTFDNQMEYTMNLDVPAKYLGKDVSQKLAELSKTNLDNMKVDVPVKLTGSFTNPKIQVDLKSAVSKITQKIIDEQKEELKDKAKDKVKDKAGEVLEGLFGKDKNKDDKTEKDKTSDDQKADKEKSKKDKKKEVEDKVKDKAKDALDGLFGKKDKDKKNKK